MRDTFSFAAVLTGQWSQLCAEDTVTLNNVPIIAQQEQVSLFHTVNVATQH